VSIDAESAAGRSPDAEPWRLRLKDSRGTILGAGIALTGGAVLTCAHVVTKAHDYGDNVEITAEWVELGTSTTARIVPGCWAPTLPGGGADIALLRTTTPTDLPGATLHRLPAPRNRTVHAFGFPVEHDFGIWASAVLAGTGGPDCEWIQLDHGDLGSRIRPGFSGAAALDDVSGSVVGMVVTSFREAKLAWIIPVDTLRRHVPAIDQWIGDDVEPDGWQPTIGVLVIQIGSLSSDRVVDASGKSTAELSEPSARSTSTCRSASPASSRPSSPSRCWTTWSGRWSARARRWCSSSRTTRPRQRSWPSSGSSTRSSSEWTSWPAASSNWPSTRAGLVGVGR